MIRKIDDAALAYRLVETGPARAAIEFVAAVEERGVAAEAVVAAGLEQPAKLGAERALGALVAQHLELLRGEALQVADVCLTTAQNLESTLAAYQAFLGGGSPQGGGGAVAGR